MTGQLHPYSWELAIPHDMGKSVLKEQSIINTINSIHSRLRQQKSDLHSCLPELRHEVPNLMDD